MNSKLPAFTNQALLILVLCMGSEISSAKGDGVFSLETSVRHTNASKTKGTLKLTVSYSEADAVLKIKQPSSQEGCYEVVKNSQIFRGWKTKKQIRRNGSLDFKIVGDTRPCDLVLEVEADEGSVKQSVTRTIHLREALD